MPTDAVLAGRPERTSGAAVMSQSHWEVGTWSIAHVILAVMMCVPVLTVART
jgi:hypothetical protein